MFIQLPASALAVTVAPWNVWDVNIFPNVGVTYRTQTSDKSEWELFRGTQRICGGLVHATLRVRVEGASEWSDPVAIDYAVADRWLKEYGVRNPAVLEAHGLPLPS